MSAHSSPAAAHISSALARVRAAPKSVRSGRLQRVSGLVFEVTGLPMVIGQRACIEMSAGGFVEAECIGFNGSISYLMPIDPARGIAPGAVVYPANTPAETRGGFAPVLASESLPLGETLLGRIVDGYGRPLDGRGYQMNSVPGTASGPINPLVRSPIREPMDVGVRAINALLTIGRGQRVGIFAGSGVGKSVLLGMLARSSQADVIVIGMVGERGREVREFCEDILGEEALKRSVVVAAPADSSPLARLQGAWFATDVATWFRDHGRHVVLIVDSLTRFAMAQREVALSLGEPPVSRGYPPSVFARMPELVERVGNAADPNSSVTAFYTVLLEGDDINDPIGDTARGILDGHIFLSRELADAGHYPALDVERSISRVMPRVASDAHVVMARRLKQLYSRYMRGRDLVTMGAYAPGSDAELDAALRLWPHIVAFLRQGVDDVVTLPEALAALQGLVGGA